MWYTCKLGLVLRKAAISFWFFFLLKYLYGPIQYNSIRVRSNSIATGPQNFSFHFLRISFKILLSSTVNAQPFSLDFSFMFFSPYSFLQWISSANVVEKVQWYRIAFEAKQMVSMKIIFDGRFISSLHHYDDKSIEFQLAGNDSLNLSAVYWVQVLCNIFKHCHIS